MTYSAGEIWFLIIALGIGTYLIRLSFLGLIGSKELPNWALRHLRYAPVAMLPGLVAPLAVWPEATGGTPDPARLVAAAAALLIAYWRGNVIWGIIGGAATLAALSAIG